MATTPTIPPPPANVVSVVPPIPDHIQRQHDELEARATALCDALNTQTGEPWQVIKPDLSLDRNYQTFHLLCGQKVLAITRNHGYCEKRLVIAGRVPPTTGQQDVKQWHSCSINMTVRWDREPAGVAREVERKVLVPYVKYLTNKHRTNLIRNKLKTTLRTEATPIAKLMKAEVPEKVHSYNENQIDLHMCACHKDSIGVKVKLEAPCRSVSEATYEPITTTVTISNLTLEQLREVLKVGMKMHRDREYNLKRRKKTPEPAKPKNSWDE